MNRAWRNSSMVGKLVELILHSMKPQQHQPFAAPILRPKGAAYSQMLPKKSESEKQSFACPNLSPLFVDRFSSDDLVSNKHMKQQVSVLKIELLKNKDDPEKIERVCEEQGVPLFRRYSDGAAVVELFNLFSSLQPDLALQVFNWRRKQYDYAAPMTTIEYARGITVAGRLKNVDLAIEFFAEAENKILKSTSTYNALMGVFMLNGLAAKCLSLYKNLKEEATCSPTLVTYNILISVFGRLMLVDHMEETLQEVKDLNLFPDVKTYNNLIAGYITAWNWDSMEKTYVTMKANNVRPNLDTHRLMLRGYAHSCKLEKMEETYALIKDHVNSKEIPLIRSMISAYCNSSVPYRLERIEELLLLIPENEYRPWLNVLLISVYARADLLERMENWIFEAFERNTSVTNLSIMQSIITCYFRSGAVDNLANFGVRAESSGWRICRSLYHCKMVMYSSQQRLMEMEKVLDEMDMKNISIGKKTLWILYKAYSQWGHTSKVEQVMGLMFKQGYTAPLYENSSCDAHTTS